MFRGRRSALAGRMRREGRSEDLVVLDGGRMDEWVASTGAPALVVFRCSPFTPQLHRPTLYIREWHSPPSPPSPPGFSIPLDSPVAPRAPGRGTISRQHNSSPLVHSPQLWSYYCWFRSCWSCWCSVSTIPGPNGRNINPPRPPPPPHPLVPSIYTRALSPIRIPSSSVLPGFLCRFLSVPPKRPFSPFIHLRSSCACVS